MCDSSALLPDLPTWSSHLARLGLASILAGAIGIERRFKGQTAGLRTQMLIGAGSCLVMEVSGVVAHTTQRGDPGQIAQSILSGIGFLGGGAILRSGVTIQGLTTAATIWCSAAIGLAAGAGMTVEATGLAALALLALLALNPLESLVTRRRDLRRVRVRAKGGPELVPRIQEVLQSHDAGPDSLEVKEDLEGGRIEVTFIAIVPEDVSGRGLLSDLEKLPGVTGIELE